MKLTSSLCFLLLVSTTSAWLAPSRKLVTATTPTSSRSNNKAASPLKDAATSAAEVPRGGAASGSDAASANSQGGGTATIPNEVFNLVKSIVGAGVLSLPAGTRKEHKQKRPRIMKLESCPIITFNPTCVGFRRSVEYGVGLCCFLVLTSSFFPSSMAPFYLLYEYQTTSL